MLSDIALSLRKLLKAYRKIVFNKLFEQEFFKILDIAICVYILHSLDKFFFTVSSCFKAELDKECLWV